MSTPTLPTPRFRATRLDQHGTTVFTFVLTAEQLVAFARVDRFGEKSDGVNRKFNEGHAIKIAQAMIEPDTVMLDAICGDLKGTWRYENGTLIGEGDAYLSIDDGQHRWAACGLLNPEERARWSFTVCATMGLDYETRQHIFRQQRLRRPIDARLDLAQRHRLDEWHSDAEREAYVLVLQLQSDPDSPLKGMIILDETVKRPYEHQHRTQGINANGLWQVLKSVMSKGSPLFVLSVEKRAEVARNMIRLASEIWPKAWCSPNHILSTARGINAVMMLLVSSPEFRGVIGDDFRIESLRNGLSYASSFNWTAGKHKNANVREITDGINNAIRNARQRALQSSDNVGVTA